MAAAIGSDRNRCTTTIDFSAKSRVAITAVGGVPLSPPDRAVKRKKLDFRSGFVQLAAQFKPR